MANFHEFSAVTIDGEDKSLSDYSGQVLLVVNVASQCGLTPHYKGLEAVHRKYADRGFAVLGFPCNQFGAQEPGSEEEIKTFCSTKFDVTFPLFSKIEVNGDGRHPAYQFLATDGAGPEEAGDIKWNFTKFVIGKDGNVVARFDPTTEPDADGLIEAIENSL